ncbi:TPA: hypothetical protein SL756_004020 [Pseudomonas aeruginosa]|nr:hypothetical protein [Pseudomonas aeruginosa]
MTKANECTCPSGNGSLRHPCPAHPASVEQAGGDERAAFELFVRKHCGMPAHIAVNWDAKFTNDAWAGWQARAALAQPSPAQTQPSPAPTLRAAIDVANDRFEVPVAKWGTDLVGEEERPEVAEVAFVLRNIGAMDAEDIDGDNVDLRFEDAEGRDTGCDVSIVEYAEKAADLFEQHDRIVGELRADRDSWAEQAEQRLADWDEMRKERDAALVEVERLRESKGDPVGSLEKCMKVMYERDEHAKRLEAAMARVAELEKELAMARDAAAKGDAARRAAGGMEMEIQELREKVTELQKELRSRWTYASTQATNCAGCGEYKHTPLRVDWMGGYVCLTCIDKKLEELHDDQAQHSVPEEFIGRLSEFLAQRGTTGKALLRELHAMLSAAPAQGGE